MERPTKVAVMPPKQPRQALLEGNTLDIAVAPIRRDSEERDINANNHQFSYWLPTDEVPTKW
jgi:hypothetical protein